MDIIDKLTNQLEWLLSDLRKAFENETLDNTEQHNKILLVEYLGASISNLYIKWVRTSKISDHTLDDNFQKAQYQKNSNQIEFCVIINNLLCTENLASCQLENIKLQFEAGKFNFSDEEFVDLPINMLNVFREDSKLKEYILELYSTAQLLAVKREVCSSILSQYFKDIESASCPKDKENNLYANFQYLITIAVDRFDIELLEQFHKAGVITFPLAMALKKLVEQAVNADERLDQDVANESFSALEKWIEAELPVNFDNYLEEDIYSYLQHTTSNWVKNEDNRAGIIFNKLKEAGLTPISIMPMEDMLIEITPSLKEKILNFALKINNPKSNRLFKMEGNKQFGYISTASELSEVLAYILANNLNDFSLNEQYELVKIIDEYFIASLALRFKEQLEFEKATFQSIILSCLENRTILKTIERFTENSSKPDKYKELLEILYVNDQIIYCHGDFLEIIKKVDINQNEKSNIDALTKLIIENCHLLEYQLDKMNSWISVIDFKTVSGVSDFAEALAKYEEIYRLFYKTQADFDYYNNVATQITINNNKVEKSEPTQFSLSDSESYGNDHEIFKEIDPDLKLILGDDDTAL